MAVFGQQKINKPWLSIDQMVELFQRDKINFFKQVQNKRHWAAHGHTAAEIICLWLFVNPKIKIFSKKFGPYLTPADDGPNTEYTEELLRGLKERGVKATSFLLGKEVEKSPALVEEIYKDGHLIGNHSYEHVNLSTLSDEAAVLQVDKTNEAIYQVTGVYPEYIRPPFGCWKCNLDYETKMIEVLWDVDPRDWATEDAGVVTQSVVSSVRENDIILLHDASESSVNAAFAIIDELQKQGYKFVTVDEILFD